MFLTTVLADDTSKSLSEAEIMKVASVLDVRSLHPRRHARRAKRSPKAEPKAC